MINPPLNKTLGIITFSTCGTPPNHHHLFLSNSIRQHPIRQIIHHCLRHFPQIMRGPGIAVGAFVHGSVQRQQFGTVQQLGGMLQGLGLRVWGRASSRASPLPHF